ncbi:MAG: Baseplate J-like protein [Syntrophus sp. PtaB.Bin001]|nr:MAG: Baseplate J-like protein [Syntrophus sp. PtaB.Bin001]
MSFKRPTLAELIKRAVNDFNSRLEGTDSALRRSNTNALARMHSGAVHGLYGYLAYIAEQVMYDTAEGEYLERWASIWDIDRKEADYASGAVIFTGTSGAVIPAGTELQRSDEIAYTLDTDVTLAGGTGTGTVTASTAGSDGNADGGVSLSFTSAIEGVATSATVGSGGIAGGSDQESDDDLRSRLLERIQQPPHGGASFDYVAWALEISGVTRAWCFPQQNGLGTVGVTFVCDDQEDTIIPDVSTVAAVQAHIDEERPVTADVTVYAPTAVTLDLTIRITPGTDAVKTAIKAELQDLIVREAEPGATILLSHINEAISIAAGETDHILISPTVDVTHNTGQIAILGTITWQ